MNFVACKPRAPTGYCGLSGHRPAALGSPPQRAGGLAHTGRHGSTGPRVSSSAPGSLGRTCVGIAFLAATTHARQRRAVQRGGRKVRPRAGVRLHAVQADTIEKSLESDAVAKSLESIPLDSAAPKDEPEDRFLIVALVAAAYVIWQMDKVNLSVAIIPMAAQYGWDAAQVGLIQSSLFWGYAATTIIGGILAKEFGGKAMLLAAVTIFSTGTILGPSAANVSTEAFILTRIMVGIGEGLAPGAALTTVAAWVPKSERSRAVATLGSGKNAGSIIGLLLAPLVISAFGWQGLFYSFGSLGLLWAASWAVFGQDRVCSVDECEVPAMSGAASGGEQDDGPIPWMRILTTPQIWGVIAAHFGHDWGAYALLTWTPKYLNQVLGYDLQGSSQLTILPGACAVVVAALGSTAADGLLRDGMDLTSVRKLAQGLGFFLPCVSIGFLATLTDIQPGSPLPIVLIIGGVATSALSYSGLYASHADLNKKYSGVLSGISTTFGALAGVGSNAFAGYALKETGSWSLAIFIPSVAFFLIGWVLYQALYDATPVDWDAPDDEGGSTGREVAAA